MELNDAYNNLDTYDYIDKLELAEKLLGYFAVAFWFVSIVSVVIVDLPVIIWSIGLVLPIFIASTNRLTTMFALSACVIVYIVVSVIVTHEILCFFPHIACNFCLFVDGLVAGSLRKVQNCDYYLREKTRDVEYLNYLTNEQDKQDKEYKKMVNELYMLVNEDAEDDKKKLNYFKEKIYYV